MSLKQQLNKLMADHPEVSLAILFGSLADNRETPTSDIDIAVTGSHALRAAEKQQLIEELVLKTGRPVDLVDLYTIWGTVLRQILAKGTLIYRADHSLYAELIKKMLFNQSDMMPYHYRILKERRKQWLSE